MLNIDKSYSAKLMGFSKAIENPIYAQFTRSKFEPAVMHLCSQIMLTLNKLASDLVLFSTPEFGFVTLPGAFCTGSSIMPQKKNPDVLELVRGKYHVVLGEEFKALSLAGNLISGYNRDAQLAKGPLFACLDITLASLNIMAALRWIRRAACCPRSCSLRKKPINWLNRECPSATPTAGWGRDLGIR